jgi:hypothetical protein
MIPPNLITRLFHLVAVAALMFGRLLATSADEALLGRWALTIPGGAPGWLEVKKESGWYDGSILWGTGSVLPLASVTVADGTLTVTRVRDVERKDSAGKVVRTQQLTETITAHAAGDTLQLVRLAPRNDGRGFDRAEFTGRRIPPLPPRPDLAKVKFGAPIALCNGRDLTGWRLIEPAAINGWSVDHGVLLNRPTPAVAGQPRRHFGNLRTEREFDDFNLTLEVKVPAKSNSGIYLRGIYEVQVLDSAGKPLDSHNLGAIYSRITPTSAAEKPANEWQTLDITLVERHVTIVLNGVTIIDNQPLAGCTGGALWSDESRPGPIYLQGDHGAVDFRNLVLRPVVK